MKPEPRSQLDLKLRWGGRFASKKDVMWHSHEQTELVAVTKGRCRCYVGGETLEGIVGSISVLPAHVAQYQETMGETRTTYIGLDVPPALFDERPRVVTFNRGDPALSWMEQLCDSRLHSPLLSTEVVRSLLVALLRRIDDAGIAEHARLHPAVRTALAFLEKELTQPLTLEQVARAAGVSSSHLSALFAAEFGVGPMHYLQRLRMERGCWLLSAPYLRIHEVAEACGYEDVNYFTRLFRQTMGVSPGRWRGKKSSRSAPTPTSRS